MRSFVGLMTADVEWVNIVGMRWRWLVTEGHNTIIDAKAAAHDPGK